MRPTSLLCGLLLLTCGAFGSLGAEPPLAEKFLLEGKLKEGIAALEARLAAAPKDDQARLGLGVTQFLRAFEKLGENLYRYGVRTERTFIRLPPPLRELLAQNPDPETISYDAARAVLQTFVDDVGEAEKTFAAVADESVKLPLPLGKIKIDLFGQNRRVSAGLFLRIDPSSASMVEQVESFSVTFDRGDACWFRGYCNLLMAWSEVLLSLDAKEFFHCTAHRFFERVDSPYPFLQQDRPAVDEPIFRSSSNLIDAITAIHLTLRFRIAEPERLKAAHQRLKNAVAMSREMWTHFNKETDDDQELIPNPRQTGAAGVKVSQEIQDAWIESLREFELVLDGKKLIPFWRPFRPEGAADVGVNVRRAFYESKEFDLILWIQGSGAAPFLEKGEPSSFTSLGELNRLTRPFGGNWVPFMFWFN